MGTRVSRLPEPTKRLLRPVRRRTRNRFRRIHSATLTRVRVSAYRQPKGLLARALPAWARRRLRADAPPVGERRVEIGSGERPQDGYVHIDVDPAAPSLDLLVKDYRLPLPDSWADEIFSCHMLEHVTAGSLRATLREWARVLRPGGILLMHTPNGRSLAKALLDADGANSRAWAVESALFGYGRHPRKCTDPDSLGSNPDHKFVFTLEMLRELLLSAGFERIVDVTGQEPCYHWIDWNPYIPDLCLELQGHKAPVRDSE